MTGSIDEWVDFAWASLDQRWQRMIVARVEGHTLGDIGGEHGVSRERARQLLVKAQNHMLTFGDMLGGDWRERLRELAVFPAVQRADVAAALDVEDHVAVAVFAQAVGFKPPRTWAGELRGWWAERPDALVDLLRKAMADAPLREGELAGALAAAGVPASVPVTELLSHPNSPLVPGHGGTWLRRRARGRDAAYLWLLAHGEPCRAEQLVMATGITTKHAVSEALRRDDRFVHLRPEGTWALAEWPHVHVTPYANAVEALVAVVTELGPVSKEILFARVAERYSVTAWRMQQCLLSDRIGTTEDGLIDLVARGATPNEEGEPSQPPTMAVDPAGNVYGIRLTVDKDVLRGSGIIVHSWITWKLGLRRAPMSRTFSMAEGYSPLTVRRGTAGAQISSLRRYAQAYGMVIGCELVVLLRTDDSTAHVRHACATDSCPASP